MTVLRVIEHSLVPGRTFGVLLHCDSRVGGQTFVHYLVVISLVNKRSMVPLRRFVYYYPTILGLQIERSVVPLFASLVRAKCPKISLLMHHNELRKLVNPFTLTKQNLVVTWGTTLTRPCVSPPI
jgi:hypothetical protein